jgi:hypothetical protein
VQHRYTTAELLRVSLRRDLRCVVQPHDIPPSAFSLHATSISTSLDSSASIRLEHIGRPRITSLQPHETPNEHHRPSFEARSSRLLFCEPAARRSYPGFFFFHILLGCITASFPSFPLNSGPPTRVYPLAIPPLNLNAHHLVNTTP